MDRRSWWLWALAGGSLFAWGAYKLAKMTRGIRNNNPGNLRPMSRPWDGEVSPDTAQGGPFSRFSSPFYGWRAAAIDVFGDIRRDGLNTIRLLVSEYAPATDNNDEALYRDQLVKAVGVGPDFPLNIWLHGPALLKAIAKHENGIDPDLIWGSTARLAGTQAGLDYIGA